MVRALLACAFRRAEALPAVEPGEVSKATCILLMEGAGYCSPLNWSIRTAESSFPPSIKTLKMPDGNGVLITVRRVAA